MLLVWRDGQCMRSQHTTGHDTDAATLENELHGCKVTMARYARVPEADIVGFRSPFLQYSANSLRAAASGNFEYDSSVPEPVSAVRWACLVSCARAACAHTLQRWRWNSHTARWQWARRYSRTRLTMVSGSSVLMELGRAQTRPLLETLGCGKSQCAFDSLACASTSVLTLGCYCQANHR